nr:hypothetical protein [Nocardioides luti]
MTVSTLVYPALLRPTPDAGAWSARHAAHSRGITPLVVVVYGALLAACVTVLVTGPRPPAAWVALAASAVAGGLTAGVAAPAHGRLGRGRDARVEARLTWADRGRAVAAVVAAAAAATAYLLA